MKEPFTDEQLGTIASIFAHKYVEAAAAADGAQSVKTQALWEEIAREHRDILVAAAGTDARADIYVREVRRARTEYRR